MTFKQKMFVKRYLKNGGNGTQAALDIYGVKNYNTAHAIAVENLQKPTIRREVELALEAVGLNDEYISELLKEATLAGMGEKATNADSLRGIDMMLRLKDAYPTQKTAHLNVSLRENLRKKSMSELQEELDKLNNVTKRLLEDIKS